MKMTSILNKPRVQANTLLRPEEAARAECEPEFLSATGQDGPSEGVIPSQLAAY